jgi:hypothetical protein
MRAIAFQFRPTATSEFDRRQSDWATTYGFASACESRLLPSGRVILVNPALAPGEIAEPVLAIDPEATHFAYNLGSRVVGVHWDLSSTWLPATGEADYVALWQSQTSALPPRMAAATAEKEQLDAAYASDTVCSYADHQGSRGTIYATSPEAVSAIDRGLTTDTSESALTGLARPYGSLSNMLRAYLGLLSLWGVGLLLISAIAPHAFSKTLIAGLALPLGAVAAASELTSFSFLHLPWVGWALAAPLLIPALIVAARLRSSGTRLRFWSQPRLSALRADPVQLLVVGAAATLAAALFALAPFGIAVMDGFTAGYFKAHLFQVTGNVVPYYQHASAYFYSHPTHPPLIPLTVDWLYLVIGTVDEHATLILWPAILASLMLIFVGLLRRLMSTGVALWWGLAIALSASDLIASSLQYGYADLALGLFLVSGVGLVWLWLRSDAPWQVMPLAGALLAGAAWTKEEGIVGGPAMCLLVAVVVLLARRTDWRALLGLAAGFLVAAAPLLILRHAYPAPEIIVQGSGIANAGSRLPVILVGMFLRAVQHWYLPLAVLLLAAWRLRSARAAFLSIRTPALWVPVIFVGVQFVADLAGIAVNTMDVSGELGWAGGRLLTQLTPVVYLVALTAWASSLQQPESAFEPRQVLQPTIARADFAPTTR